MNLRASPRDPLRHPAVYLVAVTWQSPQMWWPVPGSRAVTDVETAYLFGICEAPARKCCKALERTTLIRTERARPGFTVCVRNPDFAFGVKADGQLDQQPKQVEPSARTGWVE